MRRDVTVAWRARDFSVTALLCFCVAGYGLATVTAENL
jgi:hypothetical protein